MKNAALQAMEKIKTYYQKTDAVVFTVATLIDPCLKLFYHIEHNWEEIFITTAKNQFKMVFEEHYYHPVQAAESDSDIEDDLTSHIYKQHREVPGQDELELYLASTRAPRKTKVLEWWKVNNLFFIL
jgi:hypothetical protein